MSAPYNFADNVIAALGNPSKGVHSAEVLLMRVRADSTVFADTNAATAKMGEGFGYTPMFAATPSWGSSLKTTHSHTGANDETD